MGKTKYFHKPTISRVSVFVILIALTLAFAGIFIWNIIEQIKIENTIADIKKDGLLKTFEVDKAVLITGLVVAGIIMISGSVLLTYTNKFGVMLIALFIGIIAIVAGAVILYTQGQDTNWTIAKPTKTIAIQDYILNHYEAQTFFGEQYDSMKIAAQNLDLSMITYGALSITFGGVMILACGFLAKSRRLDILMEKNPSHAGDENTNKKDYDPMEV